MEVLSVSGGGSLNKGNSRYKNAIKALENQIEQCRKQIESLSQANLSQETKDEKKKALEEKIKSFEERIMKMKTEQAAEAVKKSVQSTNKGGKTMTKEEAAQAKLLEAGVALDLSKNLKQLRLKASLENQQSKKYQENDKALGEKEAVTGEEIAKEFMKKRDEASKLSEKRAKELATEAFYETLKDLGEDVDIDELTRKFNDDLSSKDFRPVEEKPLFNYTEFFNLMENNKTLQSVYQKLDGFKESFLEKLTTKLDKAIDNLSNMEESKAGEANKSLEEIKEIKEGSNKTDSKKSSDSVEEAIEDIVDDSAEKAKDIQ